MEELEAKDYLAAWSDIISLFLISFAILVAGIDPHRRVWGRSKLRRFLIILAISANVLFSAARLVFEGVLVETGPREFLLASVVYCARWTWLYVGISRSGSRSQKAFKVASELKKLKTVRLGTSTRQPNPESKRQTKGFIEGCCALFSQMWTQREAESSTELVSENLDRRLGEKELVIRRGERAVSGTVYWRGVEEKVQAFPLNDNSRSNKTYFVRLVERELHSTHLDEIGTYDYKKRLDVEGPDGLYKKIYELVMTCDSQSSELTVDYSPFLISFGGVAAGTAPAIRTGSNSTELLGDVARRVAADACYYVFHDGAELRMADHVKCINTCIENAAKAHLGIDTDDGEYNV